MAHNLPGWGHRAVYAANVMVLVAIGWMLLRPGGLIGGSLRDWNARRQTVASLHDQWPKLAGGESRLDSGAAIVALVEFADYQCPYCRVQHAALSSLLRAKPRVGVVYRHFPLSSHLAARGAALAAICAEEQGRFRAMHARLLETNNWASDANWIREAEVVGIPDRIRFQSCLDSPRSRSRLEADVTLGRAMSVTGTPAFVTRHGVFVGVQSEAELLRLVAPE